MGIVGLAVDRRAAPSSIGKATGRAGQPAHGLRKVDAASGMGNTDLQIMAIDGWSTVQQASHRTKPVNRRLSDQGMSLIADARDEVLDVPLFENTQ